MNNQPENERSPKDILAAITKGKITMRPKWVFLLEHGSMGLAIVLVAVGLVYLGSFVMYLWRAAEFSELGAFGSEGYRFLFRTLPWWQLFFILLGTAAFIYLLRRSTRLYRWPLVGIIGVFVMAFIFATTLTDATRFHDRLTNRSRQGMPVPILGSFYHANGPLMQGVITPGSIEKIKDDTWTVRVDGEAVKVRIEDETRMPRNWEPSIGDEIVIMGPRDDDTITAFSVHPADQLPARGTFRINRNETPPLPPAY